MFGVIFTCKEARAVCSSVMVEAGTQAWLTYHDGWHWGTTFSPFGIPTSRTQIPEDVATFETITAAMRFMKTWEGAPWYIKPDGKFEVVPLRQKFKRVPAGYEIPNDRNKT